MWPWAVTVSPWPASRTLGLAASKCVVPVLGSGFVEPRDTGLETKASPLAPLAGAAELVGDGDGEAVGGWCSLWG